MDAYIFFSKETDMKNGAAPWDFLDAYKGTVFSGEWPTLPEMFRITVSRFPDRPCFTIFDPEKTTLTYSEAMTRIVRVAQYLRSIGVDKEDRVAVCGSNSPEWATAYLAVLFAGAVVVPIDYQLRNEEVENLVRASGAKALFVDEEKLDFFEKSSSKSMKVHSLAKGRGAYIYELASSGDFPIRPAATEDLAAILFTSGTTGTPKGVMLTHRNLVSDCYLAQANLSIYHTDVFYALLPLHHSYCMLAVFIEALSVGAEIVFGKRLVIKQILHDLKAARVTMFLGVPLLFNKVLAGILRGIKEKGPAVNGILHFLMWKSGLVKKVFKFNPGKKLFHTVLDKASLATVRICISGGGPLAPSVFRKYNQLGIDFVQGYGLTETSPILTLNPIDRYKETSVGKVIPGADLKIVDPDERGAGEIVVKGPMVMKGYYNMPEETAEVFTDDGYFRTGDVGYLDDENYLYLTGRAKNLIVTEGGKNVYPEELENCFQLYGEIDQILVRGYITNPELKSEEIEALVFPNPDMFKAPEGGTEERIKALVDEVNKGLLPYQRIKRVTVLDEPMEMTTTKKIKRHAVG